MNRFLEGLRHGAGKYNVQVSLEDDGTLDEILSVEDVTREPALYVEDIPLALEVAIEEEVESLHKDEEFACVVASPVLQWDPSLGIDIPPVPQSTPSVEVTKMALTFKRTHVSKTGAASYKQAGENARILIPKALFVDGVAPAEIQVEAEGLVTPVEKVKLTKEERATLRAAETPEQKAEKLRKQIELANKRMAKLQAEMSL